jgi:arginine decarboxylase
MPSNSERAPIYEMLENHAGLPIHAYHVPGHKQRSDWRYGDADYRYGPLLRLDLTELPDTDDLHHPSGAIAEAQRLAAECYGAEETRFLVGGSTAGNLAMILGVCNPDDVLLVQRNVHRSVIHGLMLGGVRAVFLQPELDPQSGLAVIPEAEAVERAVARHPNAKGMVLCSPNYYGMSGDVRTIADICHRAGLPVMVDEAHGPHFGFHSSFPLSALQAGADIVVQSTHKMLSAMTMGAMLHIQGSLINRESVRQALRMVQSSSPSFPILASLDLARRQLHMQGAAAFDAPLQAVRELLNNLQSTRFRALNGKQSPSVKIRQDPLKVVLFDANGEWDGFRIRDELASRGCIAEMADSRYAVMVFGSGSTEGDGEALLRALSDCGGTVTANESERPTSHAASSPDLSDPDPVRFERMFPVTVRIPLEQSVGRTAGEWIVPYPPGIPELFPGERITEQTVDRLKGWRRQGAVIQGAEDSALEFIRVRHT